jgi:hypothetical protein
MPDFNQENVIIGVGVLKVDGVSIGYTSGGVNLVAASDRMDKEVDQSYAPIGIHKIRETYQIVTNLAEATLANLKIVWEQTETIVEESTTRTLSWGMNPAVVEHTLEFQGLSPEGYARTFSVYKAVVWEVGEVAHQKDALTLIPVTFRILPDVSKAAGKEYGYIQDKKTA